MINAETVAELEARRLPYILGVRERTDKLVLDDAALFAPLVKTKRGKKTAVLFVPQRFGSARQVMMQRFQKQPIVTALGTASRQRRAEHRNPRLPIQFRHCRGHAEPPNQSAIHESLLNASVEHSIMYLSKLVHTA